MLKTKSYNKNYNQFNDYYQLVLPLNLENLILEDDSVPLAKLCVGRSRLHKVV